MLERNRITDSGGDAGIAIDIQGQTKDLKIVGNELKETREPAKRVGIRIAGAARNIELAKNTFAGFSRDVLDQRSA